MRSGAAKRGKRVGCSDPERRAGFHVPRCSKALHIGARETSGTAFAIVSDESPISAGATFYIVDASNGLMKALTTFAFARAAVEIN